MEKKLGQATREAFGHALASLGEQLVPELIDLALGCSVLGIVLVHFLRSGFDLVLSRSRGCIGNGLDARFLGRK